MGDQTRMILPFAGMLLLALVVTGAASRYGTAEGAPAPQLGDLSGVNLVEIYGPAGAVLSGEFERRSTRDGGFDLVAKLSGTGVKAYGEVEIEIPAPRDPDQRQEFEVELRGLQPETPFSVSVDGRAVISIVTDAAGMADVEVKAAAR